MGGALRRHDYLRHRTVPLGYSRHGRPPWAFVAGTIEAGETPEQVAVIESPQAPAVVIAGAGSGKTETMAARVLWLVANQLVEPGAA